MMAILRKFLVGSLSLGLLVGAYWLYTRTCQTPPPAPDLGATLPAPIADVNADAPSEVGTVFGVGIGRVEQTQLLHRNERHEVDRDLRFEQLLHQRGNQWEITKPYLKLFFPAFRCDITANRGRVQVETVFSRPTAGDAFFSGNVVIHIVPAEPNDALECFIHLDDVSFLAARSMFSSAGSVRFLSRRAQLTGAGLELLYDEARSRLELFRIFDLHSLRLQSRELGAVADLTPPRKAGAKSATPEDPAAQPMPPADPPGDRYQCLLQGRVTIETPDRVITARDRLTIDNILWPGAGKIGAPAAPAPEPNDSEVLPYPGPNALKTAASPHAAISAIPPESFDTVVTCSGGLEVMPMEGRVSAAARREPPQGREPAAASVRPLPAAAPNRQHTTAQRIHFNALTTDTTLDGPVAMAFPLDPNGLRNAPAAGAALPMTVAAEKAVWFQAESSQVFFEGDCKVTLTRSEPNLTQEYTLTAPRLVLDIASDPNRDKEGTVSACKLVTEGGPAALRILRQGPDRLLGWTTLDAAQFQYEVEPHASALANTAGARGAQFTALGPGEIWIRNDEVLNPQADPNQFSLGRPCVAYLTNFDTLQYFTAGNRIVAADDARQLRLDYFPLTDGQYDRQIRAVVGHVEAALREIAKGHLELASLTATEGVEYEDEAGALNLVGSSLFYDYNKALVAIRGDDVQRCYLNGARVDQIDLNLKTGQIKAEFPAPGIFQVQR
ncbi:MAG: hypothetical protein FJ280_06590 [Planctomycetes bacterium]|nr:hypothetical protein [Planctomycetota bacterium]